MVVGVLEGTLDIFGLGRLVHNLPPTALGLPFALAALFAQEPAPLGGPHLLVAVAVGDHDIVLLFGAAKGQAVHIHVTVDRVVGPATGVLLRRKVKAVGVRAESIKVVLSAIVVHGLQELEIVPGPGVGRRILVFVIGADSGQPTADDDGVWLGLFDAGVGCFEHLGIFVGIWVFLRSRCALGPGPVQVGLVADFVGVYALADVALDLGAIRFQVVIIFPIGRDAAQRPEARI